MAVRVFRKPLILECIAAYNLRNAGLQRARTPMKVCHKATNPTNWSTASSMGLYYSSSVQSRDYRQGFGCSCCCSRVRYASGRGETWRGLLTAGCCKLPATACSRRYLHTSGRKWKTNSQNWYWVVLWTNLPPSQTRGELSHHNLPTRFLVCVCVQWVHTLTIMKSSCLVKNVKRQVSVFVNFS